IFVLEVRETAPPCERTNTPSFSKASKSRRTVAAVTPSVRISSEAVTVRSRDKTSRIRNLRSSARRFIYRAPLPSLRPPAAGFCHNSVGLDHKNAKCVIFDNKLTNEHNRANYVGNSDR